jgi:recombinational DNA repair ATPase RecF
LTAQDLKRALLQKNQLIFNLKAVGPGITVLESTIAEFKDEIMRMRDSSPTSYYEIIDEHYERSDDPVPSDNPQHLLRATLILELRTS